MKTYTHTPYNVELYALTHRGNDGDVRHYIRSCRGAEQILELGCGQGRVLLPLAANGHSITGLDYHPAMISELQKSIHQRDDLEVSRIKLVQGDMRTFELNQKFDRILLPFNGLYCLLHQDETLSCFEQVRKHLAPGGSFLFDVYIVDEEELAEIDQEAWDPVAEIHEEHRTIQIYERRQWEPATQRVDASYRYRIHEGTEVREEVYCIPQRYLTSAQCKHLLHQARFQITQCYGDFQYSPFTEDSYHMLVWAKAIEMQGGNTDVVS